MWHRELLTGFLWNEEIRPWVYETPHPSGWLNGIVNGTKTKTVPLCHFHHVNTIGFAHSVLNNLAIFFQSLFLFSFFRNIIIITHSIWLLTIKGYCWISNNNI